MGGFGPFCKHAMITFKDFWLENNFYFTIMQKPREIIFLRDGLCLLEIGKVILADSFSYYLNSNSNSNFN